MMKAVCALGLAFLALAGHSAQAQYSGSHSLVDLSVGGGMAQLNVVTPGNAINMNTGSNFFFDFEKSFGVSAFFLAVGLNYLHTTGNANYSYTDSSGTNFSLSNANLAMDSFDASLSLRYKFFLVGTIHPFLEAGGTAGYAQLSYDSNYLESKGFSGDFKTIDGQLEFGGLAGGGLEFELSTHFGLRFAYKYLNSTTRNFDTLKKQAVNYAANIYNASLFWYF